jgi:hypothetical protein
MSNAASSPAWTVKFHDDFDPEFDAFTEDVKDSLLAVAQAIKLAGPKAGRPSVDTLAGSRHANMKEMRFKANHGNEVWRAAFAFDPQSNAIILCAADKQGKPEQGFYKKLIATADKRFDSHLKSIEQERKEAACKEPAAKKRAGSTSKSSQAPRRVSKKSGKE